MVFWIWKVLTVFAILKYTKPNTFNNANSRYADEYFFKNDCHCILIKDCDYFLKLFSISKSQERLDLFRNKLSQSLCNPNREETMVCCPNLNEFGIIDKKLSPKHDLTDQPWIWSSRKITSNVNRKDPTLTINDRFSYDSNDKDNRNNAIDFNDPFTANNEYYLNIHPEHHNDLNYNNYRPFPLVDHHHNEFKHKTHTQFSLNPSNYDLGHFGHERHFIENSATSQTKSRSFVEKPLFDSNNNNGVNSMSCGLSVNTRIVGGKDVKTREYPWIVRLAYLNQSTGEISYRCVGSFISERHVITAAHCVTNLIENRRLLGVRIGGTDKTRNLDCNLDPILCRVPQDYKIETIIPHPNFDHNKYLNDVAIIRLITPSNSVAITPICLPIGSFGKDDSTLGGRYGIVAGWKTIFSYSESIVTQLQSVRLPIVNRTECAIKYSQFTANSRYPIEITSRQICVQGENNMNTCAGDSGSPLMDEGRDKNGRTILLGIVSFGSSDCGNINLPEVYTKVSAYMDWIINNIRS